MAIVWDPKLSVGVAIIDEQHQELFQKVDALVEALKANNGREKCAEVLGFLGDYVVEHFGAEESLMRKSGFPGQAAHVAQHRQFLETLQLYVAEFKAKGPTASLALKITSQVGDWLRTHIRKTDKDLAIFLQARQAARPAGR